MPSCEMLFHELTDCYDKQNECVQQLEDCLQEAEDRLGEAIYDLVTGKVSSALKNLWKGMTRECKAEFAECLAEAECIALEDTYFEECTYLCVQND